MRVLIVERGFGDVVVLNVIGRLCIEDRTRRILTHLQQYMDLGHRTLLLNLKEVPSIDSTGIAELVLCLHLVEDHGGVLYLTEVQPRVLHPLTLCGLTAAFSIFTDDVAAVAEIRRRPPS